MKYFSKEDKAEYVMRSTLVKSADALVTKAYEAVGFTGDIKIEPESYEYLMKINIKDMFEGELPGDQERDEYRIGDTMLLRFNDDEKAFEIDLVLRISPRGGISMRILHYEDGSVYTFDHEKNEWSLFIPEGDISKMNLISIEDMGYSV